VQHDVSDIDIIINALKNGKFCFLFLTEGLTEVIKRISDIYFEVEVIQGI
jgi:hypothetical protein